MNKPSTLPTPPQAPTPHNPTVMAGAHSYEGARILSASPAAILLAQVAAPFAAAAKITDAEAISRAAVLLRKCEEYMFGLDLQEHNRTVPNISLCAALGKHELNRTSKTVKGYLFKVLGHAQGRDIWRSALRGDHVFTPGLMQKLRSERDGAYKSGREQRSATSREN